MTGTHSFQQRMLGLPSSQLMLNVWNVISIVVINDVVSMMKINFPMVVQNVRDVKLMTPWIVTIVKTQLKAQSRLPLGSASGPSVTFHNVLVNVNTNIRSTV